MEMLNMLIITATVTFLAVTLFPTAQSRLIPAKVQVLTEGLDNVNKRTDFHQRRVDGSQKRTSFGGTLAFIKIPASIFSNYTIGCRKRRMRKFIGNKERNCTSLKPLKFALCMGLCVPRDRMNQYFVSFQRLMKKTEYQYRCSPDRFKYKKIRVYCGDDGSVTRYRIKVVDSCKCKEYKQQQNESQTPAEKIAERLRKARRKDA